MRAEALRNDALKAELFGRCEDLGAVAGNVLAKLQTRFRRGWPVLIVALVVRIVDVAVPANADHIGYTVPRHLGGW